MVTGMPNLLFTVLQHIIEDPVQLTQSMESTVKVCWLRLSKQKTSKVTFKSLIEILAPLVHRDQQTFVNVIRTNVRLYRSDGLLYTALKDSAQRSEEAAKSVTLDAAKGPVTQDAASLLYEAVMEEKMKDDNKDIDKDKDKEKEKEKDEEVEQELVKDEKNKTATVSTPKPATSSSSASSAKRQKTPQGYNSIPASTHTGVTLNSSTASSAVSVGNAAAGIKTPSRSAYKEKRRKTMDVGTPHNITAPATTAQAVIEELLGLAVSQWSRQHAIANHYITTYGNGSKGEDGKHVNVDRSTTSSRFSLPLAPCHLTIAEIMLVVGDLVSIVPGLATCVHR